MTLATRWKPLVMALLGVFVIPGIGGVATAQRPDIAEEWAKAVEARDTLAALELTQENLKPISVSIGAIRSSTWKRFEEVRRNRFLSQETPVDMVAVFDAATAALDRQRAVLDAGLAGQIQLNARPGFISAHSEDAIGDARRLVDSPAEEAAYWRMAESRWAVYEAYVALRDARGWPIKPIVFHRYLSHLQAISPTGEVYVQRAIHLIERWTAATAEADRATLERDFADAILASRWQYPGEGPGRCFSNPAVEEFTAYLTNHSSPLLRILGERRRLHDADETVRHEAAIRLLDLCFPLSPDARQTVNGRGLSWLENAVAEANYTLEKSRAERWLNQRIDHVLKESDPRCFLVYPQATFSLLGHQPALSNIDSPDWTRLHGVTRDDLRTDAAGRVGTYAVVLAILRGYEPAAAWEASYHELVGKLTTQIDSTIAKQKTLDPDISPWESGELVLRRIELADADSDWGVPVQITLDPDRDAPFPITLLFSDQNLQPAEQRHAPERTVRWVLAKANLAGEVRFIAKAQTVVELRDLVQPRELALASDAAAIFHRNQLTVLSEAGPFVLAIENEAGHHKAFTSVVPHGSDLYVVGRRYVGRIDIESQRLKDFLPLSDGKPLQIQDTGEVVFRDATIRVPNIVDGEFLALWIKYHRAGNKRWAEAMFAYDPQSQQFTTLDDRRGQIDIHDGELYRTRDDITEVYEHALPAGAWREVTSPRAGVVDADGKPMSISQGYSMGGQVLFQPRQWRPSAATPNGTVFLMPNAKYIDLGNGQRLDERRYVGFVEMTRQQWQDPESRVELYLIEAPQK